MVQEDDAVDETKEAHMIYARLDDGDRGRAWAVLVASFLLQLLMDGIVSSYGVLLTKMRTDINFMEANYTEAEFNLPGAIQPGLCVFMIGLSCPLVNAFGFRWVGVAGGILSGLSLLISSYCQDIISFTVFFGLFTGIGFGALTVCAVVAVTYYFEKYRALASGISSAGSGVGFCIIPLLIDTLATLLGWRMALLVFSIACTTIFCLGALTMKPLRVLPILTEEPFSTSMTQYPRMGRTSLRENLEPSRGYTQLETVKEEEDDGDGESKADSKRRRNRLASWSEDLPQHTQDLKEVSQNIGRKEPTKRILKGRVKRGFSMPAVSPGELRNLLSSLSSTRQAKTNEEGGDCIKVTHTSLKRGVSNVSGRRASFFHPNRDYISYDTSFSANRRLSSRLRRQLSSQAERSLFNDSLFSLTPRSPLALRQAQPSSHMHDFRDSSLHLGNGTYIGRPLALNPLSRADSFYGASLASLRYRDRRLREAAAGSPTQLTDTDLEVSFKSCLSFNPTSGLPMSRRPTNASDQQSQLQENSITVADELGQSALTIEGQAGLKKSPQRMFRRLGSFLNKQFDLSLLRSVDFWLLVGQYFTSQLVYFIPFMYLVEYAKECEIPSREAVLLITIIGIANTVGRCFCGILGNIRRLDVILISFISSCMASGCQFLLTAIPKGFTNLAFYAATYGFFSSYLTFTPIVIVNVLGLEKLTATYGNASFFRGVAAAIGPVFAGLMTKKNDCLPVFYFCGVGYAACSFLYLGFYRKTLRKRLRKLMQ